MHACMHAMMERKEKMKRIQVNQSFRIDIDLVEGLDLYKEKNGMSKNEIVNNAIRTFLDKVPPKKETPKVEIEPKKEEPEKEKKQEETIVSFSNMGINMKELNF